MISRDFIASLTSLLADWERPSQVKNFPIPMLNTSARHRSILSFVVIPPIEDKYVIYKSSSKNIMLNDNNVIN